MVDIFSHDTRAFFFSKNWATPAQWPDFDDPDMGRSHRTHEKKNTWGDLLFAPEFHQVYPDGDSSSQVSMDEPLG